MNKFIGIWYSELGATLTISTVRDGKFDGEYRPAGSNNAGKFRAIGSIDPLNYDGNRSFGMIVPWNNEQINHHSTTVWSGQYHWDGDEEVLTTTWLLTKETHPENDWLSTLVGTDVFHRQAIENETKRGISPHSVRN